MQMLVIETLSGTYLKAPTIFTQFSEADLLEADIHIMYQRLAKSN